MSVNLEVKGSLAKCLATENLIIEHKKVPTASFDVERRILVLPMWDKASATVYDLLVGHEVGHALYTDDIDWTIEYSDVPKDFINVLEDARVERLMKKKYPGLSKTFFKGYNELNDDDFFSTQDTNLDELSFIDRINLYFKIGAFHNIAFSDEENEFLTCISKLETFQEVLDLARELVAFVKLKREKVEMPQNVQNQGENGNKSDYPQNFEQIEGNPEAETTEETEEESKEEGKEESKEGTSEDTSSQGSSQHNVDEMQSKTSSSFDEKSKDLTDNRSYESKYVELPEIYLDKMIIPNEYIHTTIKEYHQSGGTYHRDWFASICGEYTKYKKSAEKEVSYLVKEFECKKSADQYARATTARTGILDTAKLHTYKYNEDLFRKVSVIPDGKNHGLIFIFDWSGSMADWMLDTYKQLLNLVWFCKKVNIPFEVYAFTLSPSAYINLQPDHPHTFKHMDDVVAPERQFRLMNLFSSNVNGKQMEEQLKNIWSCCWAFQKKSGYVPPMLDLSGTPLGDTMLTLHKLIPHFQTQTKVQKVNVVFLTDGEGYVNQVTKIHKNGYLRYDKPYQVSIRDRKTGRVYPAYDCGNFPQYSKVILSTLKDKFPTVNFVNFRIVSNRDFSTCWHWYGRELANYEAVKTKYKKDQFISFPGTGYDQFNVIPSSSLSQNDDFVVAEGASNAQIKSAFVKSLNKKRTNKKLLSSFVDMIA